MAYLKLIISCLLFGSVGLFVKNIDLASTDIVLVRTLIGASFLSLLSIFRGLDFKAEKIRKNLGRLIFSGLLLGTNWALLYQTYKYTSVSLATLLHYMAPVFVMLISPLVLRESLSLKKLLGIGLTMLGMVLLSGQLGGSSNLKLALITGLSSAILYGALIVVNKTIEELPVELITIFQLYTAGIIMLIYRLISIKEAFVLPSGLGLVSLLILSIIHTGIGELFYISSIRELGAQSVALLSYIDPLSALVFSRIFLGERLGRGQLLGAGLILGGALYGELASLKDKRRF